MKISRWRASIAAAAVLLGGVAMVAQPAGAVPMPPQCSAYENPGDRVQYAVEHTRSVGGPYGSQVTGDVCVVYLDGFSIGGGYGVGASVQHFVYDGNYLTTTASVSDCDFSSCTTYRVKAQVATSTWSNNCNGSPYVFFRLHTVTYGACL